MIISIDIDGILCEDLHENFRNAIPRQDAIDYINKLYDCGYTISVLTSRGIIQGTFKKDLEDTKKRLKEWGLKYHMIGMKPYYDFLVDDKAINSIDTLKKMFEKFYQIRL